MAKFYNVGHRGASAYARENTLVSFHEAVTRHADMIEFDLRRTVDGVIVILHNGSVKTSSGHRLPVSRVTFGELSSTAHANGYSIATFEEVLETFGAVVPFDIEIKVGGFEAEIIELLDKYPPAFAPTLSSFFPWVVYRLRNLRPDMNTALVLGEKKVLRLNILARPVIEKLVSALGVSAFHLRETIVTESVVRKLARLGLMVFVWTVDDPRDMRRFLNINVDGIITNKPDLLYETCLEMASAKKPLLKRMSSATGGFAYAP